jgi:mono/diheme cytochrome c family protein
MPSFRGKLSEAQARDLVAHVRSFAKPAGRSEQSQQKGRTPTGFHERFERLREQMDRLDEQYLKVSEGVPGGASPKSSEPGQVEVAQRSAPAAVGTVAVRELFQKHCAECHGADGTGKIAREGHPEIPDLTRASWQARRTDSRLLASILGGKGEEMPSWRGKITEAQARGLVDYVRSFARVKEGAGRREHEGVASAVTGQSRPSRDRFGSTILWLGRFHPPTVHYPIALLTAAMVSELLRIVTSRPAFDAVTRYCVGFGAVTAVIGVN